MKNKRLIIVLAVIVVILIGVFITQRNSSSSKEDTKQSATDTKKDDLPVIGILQTTSHPSLDDIREGVIEGLKNNGYEDKKNVSIVVMNAQGDQSKMSTMADSLVEKKPKLLVGIATAACQSLANATSDIPIIMGAVADPVGSGLAESNEQPGKNITGVINQAPIEKQLALLQEILPEAKTIGLLYSSGEDNSKVEGDRAFDIATELGLTPKKFTVTNSSDIAQTVATMCQEVDAIYLPTDNTIASAMETVVNEANKYDMPIIPTVDIMVKQGGLATVGINQFQLGEEAGKIGADVLNGANPATTPNYVMKDGEVLVNEVQANKLGISIPQSVLDKAKIVDPNE